MSWVAVVVMVERISASRLFHSSLNSKHKRVATLFKYTISRVPSINRITMFGTDSEVWLHPMTPA